MEKLKILDFFAEMIKKDLGIIFSESNYFQLENRLESIARALKIENVDLLYQRAQEGLSNEMKQVLIDTSTNNETSFFRDKKLFDLIKVLVTEAAESGVDRLVFWSAASSSGQEALSLAMMVKEASRDLGKDIIFSIIATDISNRILEKASLGVYTDLEVGRGLTDELRGRYFSAVEENQWKASSEILSCISYQNLNLTDKFYFQDKFNFIFCRNVLIYQSIEGKKDILSRMEECLAAGAYLALGAGESLIGLSENFKHAQINGAVIYQRK